MHRLRVRFKRGAEVKFISHLDLIRLWQRAFQRARIPIAYSEGFSPHPKISLAAPLPVRVTSDAELMDIYLTKWASPHFLTSALGQQLPPGLLRQVGVLSLDGNQPGQVMMPAKACGDFLAQLHQVGENEPLIGQVPGERLFVPQALGRFFFVVRAKRRFIDSPGHRVEGFSPRAEEPLELLL